jgi:hypothetical protein
MKTLIISLVVLFTINICAAQIIPTFTGETLNNKQVTIPSDTKGKYAFLCFATSMKAQKELETWMDPVYNKFIAKTGVMDAFFDVQVFFVPVFSGSNASMQETVRKKFSETAQDDVRGNILFCKDDLAGVMTALHIQNDNTPYFFLLDQEGKIIYRTSGAFSEKKFDEIDEMIE